MICSGRLINVGLWAVAFGEFNAIIFAREKRMHMQASAAHVCWSLSATPYKCRTCMYVGAIKRQRELPLPFKLECMKKASLLCSKRLAACGATFHLDTTDMHCWQMKGRPIPAWLVHVDDCGVGKDHHCDVISVACR